MDINQRLKSGLGMLVVLPFYIMCGVLFYYSSLIAYQQTYLWLKNGTHIDTSLYACFTPNKWTGIGPLSYIPSDWSTTTFSQWLQQPNDWIGFHNIVILVFKETPIYVAGYFASFFALMIGFKILQKISGVIY